MESFSVLEGEADLLLFDDEGRVTNYVALGALTSGKIFYHRLDRPLFHTVLVRSELVVIHEVTQGPFERDRTIFPDWAPAASETASAHAYNETLLHQTP
jgi:cupin fold WbuC family metalloprotein